MTLDFDLIDINSCVVCANDYISGRAGCEAAHCLNVSDFTSNITTFQMTSCGWNVKCQLNQNILKENFI